MSLVTFLTLRTKTRIGICANSDDPCKNIPRLSAEVNTAVPALRTGSGLHVICLA